MVILYVNRSGSTFLSRLLSEASDDIFVFPEVAFPLWLLIERDAGARLTGDALYRLLRRDPRLPALALAEERLRRICDVNRSDDPARLLRDIAAERMGRMPRVIAFKLERLIAVPGPLRACFGDPLLIHLVRDPRAVVASMMRSPVPEKPGFTMARGSPVFAARRWRNYMHRVETIAVSRPVLRIRFEELCDAPDAVLRILLTRLGLAAGERSLPGADRYAVSALDHALHPYFRHPPMTERASAWRAELPRSTIRVVERICGERMAALGYTRSEARLRGWSPTLAAALLSHASATVGHVLRTAVAYARGPRPIATLGRRLREIVVARRR